MKHTLNNPHYTVIEPDQGNTVIKAWIQGVPIEDEAIKQLKNVAQMPFIYKWIAAMPDVHLGIGATVGSVIPTIGAIIPAAVGVDIGCGMMAVKSTLKAEDLPDDLKEIRANIEKAVPHGRTHDGRKGDHGAWQIIPDDQLKQWASMEPGYRAIVQKHPNINSKNINHINHLGTLGTGNHFIEICLDEFNNVWFMLHSGSRGVGNRIGTYFIELAKKDMEKSLISLPDKNLSYLTEGTQHFDDYVEAVHWAQNFARVNRELMMDAVIKAIRNSKHIPPFETGLEIVNCHHNYVAYEKHYGKNIYVTRKGAVKADKGDLGIIPGSMGTKSYIVRGLGNQESFCSCSHGAGRKMSRTQAKKVFSIQNHLKATEGIECRKDADVIDETPGAYKSIETVMDAQRDLVEIIYTLRQVVCIKG